MEPADVVFFSGSLDSCCKDCVPSKENILGLTVGYKVSRTECLRYVYSLIMQEKQVLIDVDCFAGQLG